ncbi:carboxypeptidase regulatory-like domain-containing protein [Algoriphagus sediminis]|uniref:Carboxypeptidase regulatory-like domain-containing protein n=1 Tax=Algoriphagus sediminis TaxID=3057113 RepID=A0ABT7Y8R6_9BACT|nr:carboxypeptidase regulatory-like domain-containing protein [Algoriphagus sediminis]MDN3202899.1 carboxypeptidase regulatory-like domain-containing protein [Algoriphagus sediminis]
MKSESEGVRGQVFWLEGNQMPTISEDGSQVRKGKQAIQRTIIIYPLTKLEDAQLVDGLFKSLATDPIKEVTTDENGNFSLKLEPGAYSFFTKEEEGLFANRFDTEGNIQPVYISKGEWTELEILVDYKAAY